MSKEQVRMMNAKDKLVKESGNPLTKLFRRVLEELELGPETWNRKLTNFLKSPLSRVQKTAKDIGQERNNFNRAIAKREITWKTFQKAVQIAGPVQYSMDITLVMRGGRKVTVSTGLINNPYSKIDSLLAALHGQGLDSNHDINDYESESDEDITTETVGDVIHQIRTEDTDGYPVKYRPVDQSRSKRLGQLAANSINSNREDD